MIAYKGAIYICWRCAVIYATMSLMADLGDYINI